MPSVALTQPSAAPAAPICPPNRCLRGITSASTRRQCDAARATPPDRRRHGDHKTDAASQRRQNRRSNAGAVSMANPPPQRPAGPALDHPQARQRRRRSVIDSGPAAPANTPAALPSAPARPPAAIPSGPAVYAPVPPRPVPSPPAPARAPAVQERAPQTSGPGSPTTVAPPRPAAPVQSGVGNPEVASPASPRVTGDPPPVVLPAVAATRRPEPPPTPFDAVLGTILFSPDRKLAIVNGRIVGIGDDVNGAGSRITLGPSRDARGGCGSSRSDREPRHLRPIAEAGRHRQRRNRI